jgi:hypothetical protein
MIDPVRFFLVHHLWKSWTTWSILLVLYRTEPDLVLGQDAIKPLRSVCLSRFNFLATTLRHMHDTASFHTPRHGEIFKGPGGPSTKPTFLH